MSKVIKNSRRLITVSNFEKENITNFFKLKNKEIQTVHNGVNKTFTAINMDADHISQSKIKI